MANTKFTLLESDTIELWGKTLYRIEALKDFSDVSKGEKGGYIEKESNLATSGDAWVADKAQVSGNASVSDNAWVSGNVQVSGDAEINDISDLLVIGPIGSVSGYLTAFKNKDKTISVTRGCFVGTLKEFETKVEETHGDNEYGKTYRIAIELIKNKLGNDKEGETE